VTLEFLSPVPGGGPEPGAPLASSPLEPRLEAAGARFEARDGWRVAVDFGSPASELEACRAGAGVADRSALGKLELQGPPEALAELLAGVLPEGLPAAGESVDLDGARLWRSSPDRALAIAEPAATPGLRARLQSACVDARGCALVELTAGLAAIELRGPLSRRLLERVTAIDVRVASLAPGGVRAGAVAELPATLLCLDRDAFLIMLGAPESADAFEIVLDAGAPLGARAVGERARAEAASERPRAEATAGV
jgi:sarcosine oxidase, subunit alpha